MPRIVNRLLISFGNLLNLSPRGKTQSRIKLDNTYTLIKNRTDSTCIYNNFIAIDRDIAKAMEKYDSK